MSFELSSEQIEFAVAYWLSQLTSADPAVQAKFEKALRKVIDDYREEIRYITMDVVPRRFLREALKVAGMSHAVLPESKTQMFFHEKGVDLWRDGKWLFRNGEEVQE